MRLGVVGNKLKGPALAIDNRSDYNKAFQQQKVCVPQRSCKLMYQQNITPLTP